MMISAKRVATLHIAAILLLFLSRQASANRLLLQQVEETKTGLLWKGSPLFNAAEVAPCMHDTKRNELPVGFIPQPQII